MGDCLEGVEVGFWGVNESELVVEVGDAGGVGGLVGVAVDSPSQLRKFILGVLVDDLSRITKVVESDLVDWRFVW